jgi:hypothetical protein
MPLIGWIVLGVGLVVLVVLAFRRPSRGGDILDLHTGEVWSDRPQEPGWTETVSDDQQKRLGRSFEVNDHLMTADRSPHNTGMS